MYVHWAKRWEWRPEQMQEVWSPEPHKSTCWSHAMFFTSPPCWSQAKLIQRKCAGPAAAPQSSWDPLQPAGADKSGSHSWAQIKAVKLTGENAAQPGVGRLLLWGETLRHSLQTHSLSHTHTTQRMHQLYSLPVSRAHTNIYFFLIFPPISFNWKVQKKSHLSLSPFHAKIINGFPSGPAELTSKWGYRHGSRAQLQIISEEQSLGMFYSYQDSSYLTCIVVFTESQ